MPHEVSTALPAMTTMEAMVYLLYGFGVVMITLALLWAATALISKILKSAGLDKMPQPKAALASVTAIPDETIAVITAAVSFATGGKFAIKSINKK